MLNVLELKRVMKLKRRITTARFNSTFFKLTTLVCHVLRGYSKNDENISLYKRLQSILDNTICKLRIATKEDKR